MVPESITRFLPTNVDVGDEGRNGPSWDANWIDIHTADLPDPQILTSETFYMGMPEKHVIGAQVSGTGHFDFYLRENLTLYSALLAAMQVEFNAGILAYNDVADIITNPGNQPQASDFTSAADTGPGIKLGLGTRKIFETLASPTTGDNREQRASAVRSFANKDCVITEIFDWMNGLPILRLYYVNPKIKSVKITPGLQWNHQAQLMKCTVTYEYDRPVIYPIAKFHNDEYRNGDVPNATVAALPM